MINKHTLTPTMGHIRNPCPVGTDVKWYIPLDTDDNGSGIICYRCVRSVRIQENKKIIKIKNGTLHSNCGTFAFLQLCLIWNTIQLPLKRVKVYLIWCEMPRGCSHWNSFELIRMNCYLDLDSIPLWSKHPPVPNQWVVDTRRV